MPHPATKQRPWVSGDWLAVCDICGFVHYASELQEQWDGLMVCSADYNTRHPQDLLQTIPDDPSVPWTRPLPDENN